MRLSFTAITLSLAVALAGCTGARSTAPATGPGDHGLDIAEDMELLHFWTVNRQ